MVIAPLGSPATQQDQTHLHLDRELHMAQSLPHLTRERFLAVILSDDLVFTPEEFAHLKECFERWCESMEEAGRRFEESEV